jgi:hypothetical protein
MQVVSPRDIFKVLALRSRADFILYVMLKQKNSGERPRIIQKTI